MLILCYCICEVIIKNYIKSKAVLENYFVINLPSVTIILLSALMVITYFILTFEWYDSEFLMVIKDFNIFHYFINGVINNQRK